MKVANVLLRPIGRASIQIYFPKDFVLDDSFPFDFGEIVKARIRGGKIILQKKECEQDEKTSNESGP